MDLIRKCKICGKPLDQTSPHPTMCWHCIMKNDNQNSSFEKMKNSTTKNEKITHTLNSTKKCNDCGRLLPRSDFYRSRTNPDGLTNICKNCTKQSKAAEGLKKLIKYLEFNVPFYLDELKINVDMSELEFKNYIWVLLDFDLLKFDEKSNKYNLSYTDTLKNFVDKYKINLKTAESASKETKLINGLLKSLKDEDYHVKIDSIIQMGQIKDKNFIDPLIECFNDPNYLVRTNALKSIIQFNKSSLTSLVSSLKSEESFVRINSTEALGEIADKEAVIPLIKCLNDPHYVVRNNSIIALGKIGDKRAINHLIKSLKDPETLVKESSKDVLIEFGSSSLNALKKSLLNSDISTKKDLIDIIGKINDKKSFEILSKIFIKDTELRSHIAKTLGEIGDKNCSSFLVEAIEDNDPTVRNEVSEALVKIGDKNLLKQLKYLYGAEENIAVRELIKKTIEKIEKLSAAESKIQNNKNNRSSVTGYMKCEDCGKTLPAFDFYKTKSASRGYTKKCKQCLKERTAKNALVNMKPYIRLNFPFYKKDLKNKMKKPISTLDNYIWALQELEFIEYIEDSNKYVIKSTENLRRFCNKNEIQFSYTINNEQYKTSKDVNPLDKEIKDLNDKSWFIRRRATKRIGDIGNQRAVEPLINALKDKNVFVKISAAESLGEIGDERAIQPLLNVNTRGNLKFDEIISTSIKNIKSRVENNIKKPECRTCTDCGKELPISDFYKSSNGPEGLMSYCKTCLKKRNAANALIEIKKYVSLNTSFSKERLKKLSNKSNATLGTYLHDLKELNLLEYNEHTGNYFLRPNNRLKEFCKDYNVPLFDKLPNDKNLKMCEGCGKNLPFDEFYKYHASPDGLTKKCINCIKKDNAANGIKEIIKLIGLDIPFSKERLSQKSAKLQDTINQYLRDLTLLDLIVYDESKDIYNLVLNNKIQAFSVEYGIDLKNKRKESKLDTNYLKNQMIQISTETTNSFILEFNEVAKRSDIIFILEDVKKKIFDLHLLELSVFPDGTGNISNQNYKIHIKIEVPSEKLQETLENLKARVTSKNQIELFGLMKVSL